MPMRTWTRILTALLCLWGIALTAAEPKFVGTWEAAADGKVFLVLKLQAGSKISGTLNAGSISLGENGELLETGPVEDREAPIFFARAEGDKVEFDFQDDDNAVMHFELKVLADD